MTARRRHYPGRGRNTGLAGTRAAYDKCSGCGHPRIRHMSPPAAGCVALAPATPHEDESVPKMNAALCDCAGFTETEE